MLGRSPVPPNEPEPPPPEGERTGPPPFWRLSFTKRSGPLVGGIAVSATVLLAGGTVLAAVLGSPAPYSSMGECGELLNGDVLNKAAGMQGALVEREMTASTGGASVVEWQDCVASEGRHDTFSGASPSVFLHVTRYDPDTGEEGYSKVRRDREDDFSGLRERFGLQDGEGASPVGGSGPEVATRGVSTGDGGYVFSIDDADRAVLHGSPRLGSARFTVRNLGVQVTYRGSAGVTAEEHLAIATELGEAVHRRITATIGTE